MVGPSVPFPARGGFFGVGRSETFQTLSLTKTSLRRAQVHSNASADRVSLVSVVDDIANAQPRRLGNEQEEVEAEQDRQANRRITSQRTQERQLL